MKILVLILSTAFILAGCKKEGCMNENAVNYDSETNLDNNTCKFKAKISFWFNEAVSEELIGTELRIALNEKFVGTMDPKDWKTGPDCGGDNYTLNVNLDGDSPKNFIYSIANNYGMYQFDGSISVGPNECFSKELIK